MTPLKLHFEAGGNIISSYRDPQMLVVATLCLFLLSESTAIPPRQC